MYFKKLDPMAKKFNKDERKAIIARLQEIVKEKTQEEWETLRKNYVPSERYLHAKKLLETYYSVVDELDKYEEVYYITRLNTEHILAAIRDNEIRLNIPQYAVNEKELEVEIIFAQEETTAMSDMVEMLLNKCLVK